MRGIRRQPRGWDPRDDPRRNAAGILGARSVREADRDTGDLRRFVDRNIVAPKPVITLGPFLRSDLTGTATFYLNNLFETTAGVYATRRQTPIFPVDARCIGGVLMSNAVVTAGTAQLVLETVVGNNDIGGAELNTTDTTVIASFFDGVYIDIPAATGWDVRVTCTGLTPTVDATAWVLIELETGGRNE